MTVAEPVNLRAGAGTTFDLAGGVQPGEQVNLVGRTNDGLWFLLDTGTWIFAQLVQNPPTDSPVSEPTPASNT